MAFTIDTTSNYQAWSNVEAVTLTSAATAGATQYALPTAKRRNPTYKERLPTGGVYGAALVTWLVPQAVLNAAAPGYAIKMADTITDSTDTVWTVLEAAYNALRSTWLCTTLNLSLAFSLRDTLTIKRPSLTLDADSGRTYTTLSTVYSGVQARIQETDSDTIDERGKRLTRKRYTVPVLYLVNTVATRLQLSIEDQVTDGAGNVYEIRGWRDADRIDELQKLDLERRWA